VSAEAKDAVAPAAAAAAAAAAAPSQADAKPINDKALAKGVAGLK